MSHVQETSLRGFVLYDMAHYPLVDWFNVIIKGWTWSTAILGQAVAYKQCSLPTEVPKKISPTPLHHRQQAELLIDSSEQAMFSILVSTSLGEPV